MDEINKYLDKFKDISPTEGVMKEAVAGAIREEVGVEINTQKISIQQKKARVELPGTLKSQIFIKKEAILERVQNTLDDESVTDIV